jgi:hypothetical protein
MKVERFSGDGGRDVMHNHNADSEACLNRQILNNFVKRTAMGDFSERPRKLMHKELQSEYVDTLTYVVAGTKHSPNCSLSQHILK